PKATYVFELNQDVLLAEPQIDAASFTPYSTYPAVDRDLAFFIATDIPVQTIEKIIWKAAKSGQLLDSVELFDEYKGESVPEGQRSLAFRLIYRASDRTLTEEDVTPIHEQVRQALSDKLNASLRS
ncbi:MAG: phenylalanine--tRNA ligase subunit beta, partial [Thermosynechococcaceae cyanobacterium]